jgi:hypothetical protein
MYIRGQLSSLRLSDGESIREYGRRAIDIKRSLLDVGATCGEEELVDYILLGLPPTYHTIRTIIGDSNQTNLEQVLRRLARYQEQELQQAPTEAGVGLTASQQPTHRKPRNLKLLRCFNCNRKGHVAANCRLPNKRGSNGTVPPGAQSRALIATALSALASEANNSWIVDTGATHHMTSDGSGLTDTRPSPVKSIAFGGGETVKVICQGDMRVTSVVHGQEVDLALKNVLLLEKITCNLLSVATMTAKGVEIRVNKDKCTVDDHGKVIVEAVKDEGLYKTVLKPFQVK